MIYTFGDAISTFLFIEHLIGSRCCIVNLVNLVSAVGAFLDPMNSKLSWEHSSREKFNDEFHYG